MLWRFPVFESKYSRTHVIRILRGPRNLFELHDYSNYRSSDYMSSTVLKDISWPFARAYLIFLRRQMSMLCSP